MKVEDFGIGMEPETINRILSKDLMPSRAGTNDELGNGIGLSTCMKLAEQNNFRLEFESEVGRSTVFKLKVSKANY